MDPSLHIVERPAGGLPYEERGTMFGLAPRLGLGWRGEEDGRGPRAFGGKPGDGWKRTEDGEWYLYSVYTYKYIYSIYI